MRRMTAGGARAGAMRIAAACALAAALAPCAPAHAATTGETGLYVGAAERQVPDSEPADDGQQRQTVASAGDSAGTLAQTGDAGAATASALALAGTALVAAGTATARGRRHAGAGRGATADGWRP